MSIKKYGLHRLRGMTWCSGKEISLNLMAFAELELNNPFNQMYTRVIPGVYNIYGGQSSKYSLLNPKWEMNETLLAHPISLGHI